MIRPKVGFLWGKIGSDLDRYGYLSECAPITERTFFDKLFGGKMVVRSSKEQRNLEEKEDQDRLMRLLQQKEVADAIRNSPGIDYRPHEMRLTPVNPGEIVAWANDPSDHACQYPEGELFTHAYEEVEPEPGKTFRFLRIIPKPTSMELGGQA